MDNNPPASTLPWTLAAVCHKSGSRRVIATGAAAEMDSIFDLLVRHGYGLQLYDAGGVLHATTCGTLPAANVDADASVATDEEDIELSTVGREQLTHRLDSMNLRVLRLEQFVKQSASTRDVANAICAIGDRLCALEKRDEAKHLRLNKLGDRTAEVEQRTHGLAERMLKLADAIPQVADVSMDQIARRLSALEDFANDKGFRLDTINRRLNRLELTTADQDGRIADVNRALPNPEAIKNAIVNAIIDALSDIAANA